MFTSLLPLLLQITAWHEEESCLDRKRKTNASMALMLKWVYYYAFSYIYIYLFYNFVLHFSIGEWFVFPFIFVAFYFSIFIFLSFQCLSFISSFPSLSFVISLSSLFTSVFFLTFLLLFVLLFFSWVSPLFSLTVPVSSFVSSLLSIPVLILPCLSFPFPFLWPVCLSFSRQSVSPSPGHLRWIPLSEKKH